MVRTAAKHLTLVKFLKLPETKPANRLASFLENHLYHCDKV